MTARVRRIIVIGNPLLICRFLFSFTAQHHPLNLATATSVEDPAPDSRDSNRRQRLIIDNRPGDLCFFAPLKVSENEKKAFWKRLPADDCPGRGKGARVRSRSTVSAAVLVGCLYRTKNRICHEPEIAEYLTILDEGLRLLGGK